MPLLTNLAIKLNYLLRSHPSKFLYSGTVLSRFLDPVEAPHIVKDHGGTVWDVGASVGKYTALLSHKNSNHTVYAFEPNFNSLFYLAWRTQHLQNVVIVPSALTAYGQIIPGTHNADFNAKPSGPKTSTFSIGEAVAKFGLPKFVKMDVEGAEYELTRHRDFALLQRATVLISWHAGIETVKGWSNTKVSEDITLLSPLK